MKKAIYLFLVLPLIFSSCSKEEGCTDSAASNYNSDAEEDDGSCTYNITGVWEWDYARQAGTDILTGFDNVYSFMWANGNYGSEYYSGGVLVRYTLGTYTLTGQSSLSMTDIGYNSNPGGWIEDAASGTQSFTVTKINGNEFDVNDAANSITINMTKSTRSLSEFK